MFSLPLWLQTFTSPKSLCFQATFLFKNANTDGISTSFDNLPALFERSNSPFALLYVICKDLSQRIYCDAKKLSNFTNKKDERARRKLAENSSDWEKAGNELHAGWRISFPRRSNKSPLRHEVWQSAERSTLWM